MIRDTGYRHVTVVALKCHLLSCSLIGMAVAKITYRRRSSMGPLVLHAVDVCLLHRPSWYACFLKTRRHLPVPP
jgi:hypothetical protein